MRVTSALYKLQLKFFPRALRDYNYPIVEKLIPCSDWRICS